MQLYICALLNQYFPGTERTKSHLTEADYSSKQYLENRIVLIHIVVLLWSCGLSPVPVLQQWKDAEGVVLSDGHPGILGLLEVPHQQPQWCFTMLLQAWVPVWSDSLKSISGSRGTVQTQIPDELGWKICDYWQDFCYGVCSIRPLPKENTITCHTAVAYKKICK